MLERSRIVRPGLPPVSVLAQRRAATPPPPPVPLAEKPTTTQPTAQLAAEAAPTEGKRSPSPEPLETKVNCLSSSALILN